MTGQALPTVLAVQGRPAPPARSPVAPPRPGLDPRLTPEHDDRLVDDVVREWAERHGRPYTLELTGPAGGTWGGNGEHIVTDAVDFCRILSGRGNATGLLATSVPF